MPTQELSILPQDIIPLSQPNNGVLLARLFYRWSKKGKSRSSLPFRLLQKMVMNIDWMDRASMGW